MLELKNQLIQLNNKNKYKKNRKFRDSEKGMALIEAIPVLFMLVLVFNFSLGFFGAIHSGVLNSMGSYNYALETFRFRSNLMYFRPGGDTANYKQSNNRVHGVTKEGSEFDIDEDKKKWPSTVRAITFNFIKEDPKRNLATLRSGPETICDDSGCRSYDKSGSENIWNATSDYVPVTGTTIQTPRIWIKTVYGICVSADCGDKAN